MPIASPPATMTTEQMLALPDNGMDRELFRGELREKPRDREQTCGDWRDKPMTMRNRRHSRVETRVAKFLDNWLDTQPEPRGEVVSGEAGFRLRRNPDSSVGIDVAYASADQVANMPAAAFYEGPPILAVEVLSPSDQQEEIAAKVALYLESGVAVVWVIDPIFRTVVVHRPGSEPEMFNALQALSAEPHLPGFLVPVASLFPA